MLKDVPPRQLLHSQLCQTRIPPKKRSCETQLPMVTRNIHKALDNNIHMDRTPLDFFKAFNIPPRPAAKAPPPPPTGGGGGWAASSIQWHPYIYNVYIVCSTIVVFHSSCRLASTYIISKHIKLLFLKTSNYALQFQILFLYIFESTWNYVCI